MWFADFVQRNEQQIIESWLDQIDKEYPGMYDLGQLRLNSQNYVKLLLHLDTPLREHPYYDILPHVCKYHAQRGTPVEHVMHSSHMWRQAVLKVLKAYSIANQVTSEELWVVLPKIHTRIDEVQRGISKLYWEYAQSVIYEKQQRIEELHDDRLSILGKMAASMAHEIRNPLFAIQGFLQLIRSSMGDPASSSDSEKIQRYINVIEKEFNGLYAQISSFLSFSKNNGTEEPIIECSVREIIEPVLNLVGPRALTDRVEIVRDLTCEANLVVQKIPIQQVVANLINNALDAVADAAEPKKLAIRCHDDDQHIYIQVTDNGIGIPPEMMGKIYEPFVTNKKNGTGLGLAICKQIVERNVGTLTCSSKPGETIFTIALLKNCGLIATE